MKNKKVWFSETEITKIIEYLENKNQLVFHSGKEIYILAPDEDYNTLSKVSIYPPYKINTKENGSIQLETGSESNFAFNYVYSLKTMFLEAATKIGLI